MRTPHSSTNKGKRVMVTMRDGGIYIGKFKDKKSGTIVIEDWTYDVYDKANDQYVRSGGTGSTRISMGSVRAFSIYKPTQK